VASTNGYGGDPVLATYRMSLLYRWQILIAFPLFAIFAIVLVIVTVRHQQGPPLVFTLLWIAALSWNAYWFLFRLCYRIELHEDALYWWAPLRHGRRELADLRAVRPGRMGWNVAVFEATDGTTVVTLIRRGFAEFAAAVHAAAPHVSVSIGRYARIADRLPGFSGYRRGDPK
jgi:hypothetical protein